jgi:hypothetical protein
MNWSAAKSIVRASLLLLALVGAMQSVSLAQSDNSRDSRIVGVWDVQVTLRNCTTQAPLPSGFRGLHKYELGGTVQVVPSTNPAALSQHVGVWTPVAKDLYQMTFKMFTFGPTGNNTGWTVVHNDVALTEDGAVYVGSGKAETFDLNGIKIGEICPAFIGTRLE